MEVNGPIVREIAAHFCIHLFQNISKGILSWKTKKKMKCIVRKMGQNYLIQIVTFLLLLYYLYQRPFQFDINRNIKKIRNQNSFVFLTNVFWKLFVRLPSYVELREGILFIFNIINKLLFQFRESINRYMFVISMSCCVFCISSGKRTHKSD